MLSEAEPFAPEKINKVFPRLTNIEHALAHAKNSLVSANDINKLRDEDHHRSLAIESIYANPG